MIRSISLLVLLLASASAHAYVGPGLGLGAIGALFGAIATALLAIFGVIWYPIKRMLKKLKKKNSAPEIREQQTNEQQENREEPAD